MNQNRLVVLGILALFFNSSPTKAMMGGAGSAPRRSDVASLSGSLGPLDFRAIIAELSRLDAATGNPIDTQWSIEARRLADEVIRRMPERPFPSFIIEDKLFIGYNGWILEQVVHIRNLLNYYSYDKSKIVSACWALIEELSRERDFWRGYECELWVLDFLCCLKNMPRKSPEKGAEIEQWIRALNSAPEGLSDNDFRALQNFFRNITKADLEAWL